MKYEIVKEEPKEFSPITFTVTLESLKELRIWRDILGPLDGKASDLTYDLFDELDNILSEREE